MATRHDIAPFLATLRPAAPRPPTRRRRRQGSIAARLPRLPISALGLLTIVTYGACYYAYGVLIQPIGAEMHWPPAALGAIFSAVLLIIGVGGILAGGLLDRVGEQPLFLLAATVGAGAMLVASFQTGLLPFAIAYAGGCGLVGALRLLPHHAVGRRPGRPAPSPPARSSG